MTEKSGSDFLVIVRYTLAPCATRFRNIKVNLIAKKLNNRQSIKIHSQPIPTRSA